MTPAESGAGGSFHGCALATTRQAARLLTQLYDSHLAEARVEAAQFALMMTIDAMAGRSQAEIGRAMGMEKTTLSRNLKLLRTKGWIGDANGRGQGISLTEAGRKQLSAAKPAWRQAQDSLRAEMSEAEWEKMFIAMQTLMRAARQAMERSRVSAGFIGAPSQVSEARPFDKLRTGSGAPDSVAETKLSSHSSR